MTRTHNCYTNYNFSRENKLTLASEGPWQAPNRCPYLLSAFCDSSFTSCPSYWRGKFLLH